MISINLQHIKPSVIAKLQQLAQENHRSLQEEITAILEQVTQENVIAKKRQWSPNFFERTSGAWQGEGLVREVQEAAQEREPLL